MGRAGRQVSMNTNRTIAVIPAAAAVLIGLAACGGSSSTTAPPPSPAVSSGGGVSGGATSSAGVSAQVHYSSACPPAAAARAVQQAVPAQRALAASGFRLVTTKHYGTVYLRINKFRYCGWTGFYANGGLMAVVGLGMVAEMGTPGHWVQSPVGTSVPDQMVYARQALSDPAAWTGLYSNGEAEAQRSAGFTGRTASGGMVDLSLSVGTP